MAKVRSGIQKEINQDLVDMGGKAFSAEEYEDNESAKKLLAMKNGSYVSPLTDPLDKAFEYRNYVRAVTKTAQAHDVLDIRSATARAFGLSNHPLIDKIADDRYLLTGMTHPCPECGHTEPTNDIQAKIDTWVSYCHMVDKAVLAIKRFPKTYEKMKRKQKDEYLKPLKLIALTTNDPLLNVIFNFAKNYGCHQGVLAKAKALLSLKLPNIDTLEIAKAITNKSSLFNK